MLVYIENFPKAKDDSYETSTPRDNDNRRDHDSSARVTRIALRNSRSLARTHALFDRYHRETSSLNLESAMSSVWLQC
jgi:hypothetical protein